MASWLTVNGVEFPLPRRGVKPTVTTIVNAGRNANAVVVGQRVGRDQYKLDGLEWAYLSAEQWSEMLKVLSNYFVNVTFPDPVTNEFITIKMYTGDRTGEPYWIDPVTKKTVALINCKANLIDTGA